MEFNRKNYQIKSVTVAGTTLRYRTFENLIYAEHPVNPEFQKMNIYVPECYYEGGSINGYGLHSAPVFMPNHVGGYMPGGIGEPGCSWQSEDMPNTIFRALQHGYVVASPAIRGRSQQGEDGRYTGKAPACIVDYKAAVRYLRYFADELPGDIEKIITNGTSAGGALSSLMGVTGNHPDYEPWLKEIGAADAKDHVFAASCYCPIINLEHADMAYEWQFAGVYDYSSWNKDGIMGEEQIELAKKLEVLFPAYVNQLGLRDRQGKRLELDIDGTGSFKEYIKQIVLDSAKQAVKSGGDLSDKTWIRFKNGEPVEMDFYGWAKDITRMKVTPAFDHLTLDSPENDLFGTAEEKVKHFTAWGSEYSKESGVMADGQIIKLLNPMCYVGDEQARTAKYWRIRHGERDRDTSLAVSAMLARKLEMMRCEVDYHVPWDVVHAGDYDLDELFVWIDEICRK